MTITGTRNGKQITLEVEVIGTSGDLRYVKKAGGAPLFGTTGYWSNGTIKTYRGAVLLTDVTEK